MKRYFSKIYYRSKNPLVVICSAKLNLARGQKYRSIHRESNSLTMVWSQKWLTIKQRYVPIKGQSLDVKKEDCKSGVTTEERTQHSVVNTLQD